MNIITFSEKAGVSVATASRALNPKTTHLVKPETCRRIQELALELNYVPNPGARVLRGHSQAPIAILLPNKDKIFLSEYFARLLSGIVHTAAENKRAVHIVAFTPDPAVDFIEQLNAATVGCGGIIYMSDALSAQTLLGLDRLHQPFVAISNCLPSGLDPRELAFPVFGAEEFKGGQIVVEHLISLGHQHIAFVNGPLENRDVRERQAGFISAMEKHNLEVRPDWCFTQPFTFESGMEAADSLHPLLDKVTAVVCGNDELALGLIRGLAEKGIRCPEQISVTGFDDALWASRYSPALTTIRQPWMRMAEASVQMVQNLGHQKRRERPAPEIAMFDSELVVRETTATPHLDK